MFRTLTVAVVLSILAAGSARAQVFSGGFSATPSVISPDGDSINDTTTLRYTLAESTLELSLVIFASDSITPVDTLIAPAPTSSTGARTVIWDGRRWDNTVAADGAYVASLSARSLSMVDTTLTIPLFVDATPPTIQVTTIDPSPYFPGVSGHVSVLDVGFNLTGVSPVFTGRKPDEIQFTILNPAGAPLAASSLDGRISFVPALPFTSPPGVSNDGTYAFQWTAGGMMGLTDGEYRIAILIVDAAGYTRSDTARAVLDINNPTVTYTSQSSGISVAILPDSLMGLARDRSGIDSLTVKYGASGPYMIVTSRFTRGDTVYFSVPVSSMFTAEGAHQLTIRAKDALGYTTGHTTAAKWDITLVTTPPGAPTLETFSGAWQSPTFTVSGSVATGTPIDARVRIRRNGVTVDSVFTAGATDFTRTIPLTSGVNVITAVTIDGAGNQSAPSNEVRVTYEFSIGFFMPVPFTPDDAFVINVSRPMDSAEIRLYDMSGDIVDVLEAGSATSTVSVPWNVVNASGLDVKRGPLVGVAIVRYADGSVERVRKIFLVQP